eukprot:CAMPEP_0194152806 /NCGR_PEP_ID=MMETSP0152-20130528/54050_1 /TAXON_ID=1049557 /ORGANISM="Thalassiothrix antarctica, Strain L6-D1" /LENGTH=231 /DNA_ID=CAMNT_0038857629 /DNA_START=11 /DNA_END=706 /DNA_ORIENTATION=+
MTEYIRRLLVSTIIDQGQQLPPEALIIVTSAGIASAMAAVVFCPFEAVRIRSVAQPDFAKNEIGVLRRMVNEEGWDSLTDAIPVFLVKQVPYAMVKFTIFDLSTEYLLTTYPSAQENLALSLGISLIGGVLGGISAAIVSNPADAVISELKKGSSSSDLSPIGAFQTLWERSALFKGLQLRMAFYSFAAALQFSVFDGIRYALGIGADDLRLYFDVLGEVVQTKGGGGGIA